MYTKLPNINYRNISTILILSFVVVISTLITVIEKGLLILSITLISIAFLYFVYKYPLIGLGITLATTPLMLALPHVPYFSSLASLIGLVTFVIYLVKAKFRLIHSSKTNRYYYILTFTFILISVPGSIIYGRVDRIWAFTYIQLFILLLLLENIVDNDKKLLSLLFIVYVSIQISVIYSLLLFYTGNTSNSFIRSIGLVGDPNEFSIYNITGMSIGFYLTVTHKNVIVKFLFIFLILLSLLTFFLSGSRGGFFTLIFAIFFNMIINIVSSKKKAIYVYMALFIFILPFSSLFTKLIPQDIKERFLDIPNSIRYGDLTVDLRLEMWKSSLEVWKEQPIFGVGSGGVTTSKIRNMLYGGLDTYYVTHNTYINILAENGILGFGVFLSLIVITLVNIYNYAKVNFHNVMRFQLIILQATILFIWLIACMTLNLQQNKYLWVAFGFGMIARNFMMNGKKVSVNHSL